MIQKNINEKMKGFTLVELLAVIVILAIILVIAVPQIMSTIEDATKASFESSAKMVASQVENQYTVAQTLGKTFGSKGSCMEDWAGLNETDYTSCTYQIDDEGNAKVTLTGKGKFDGLSVCNGTRSSATATEEECVIETAADCFEYREETIYEVKDYDSCVSYMRPKVVNEAGKTEEELQSLCSGNITWRKSFSENIHSMIEYEEFTEEELIENNVIKVKDGLEITSYNISCGTDVVIPSTINNIDVTTIGSDAFYNIGLTSVILPNTVTYIGQAAFYDNPLTKVELGNLSAYIGCAAFGNPTTITTHNLPENYMPGCAA